MKRTPETWLPTDWAKNPSIRAGEDSWLVTAGTLVVSQWLNVYPRRINYDVAQEALDAQYGKGKFHASTHGNTLNVQRLRA